MFKKISLPVQLLGVMVFIFCFGRFFNENAVRFFYTISSLFKEFLGVCLPLILFTFVLSGILAIKKNAPLILTVLVSFIFASNYIAALISYITAKFSMRYITHGIDAQMLYVQDAISPYFNLNISSPVRAESALLTAIVLGLMFSFVRIPHVETALGHLKKTIEGFLQFIFIPMLPLYVFGFLLKIYYEGAFLHLFEHYGPAFAVIVCLQICYLFWIYLVACGFSWQGTIQAIKNALPSYLTAFGTMSSTATVPVTIKCAQKNIDNPALAQLSMPIMANVHLLGDSISTPLLALVTLSIFVGKIPDLGHYLEFIFYFCTTMFAVSGIPGGGIITVLPLLESQLGFTKDMLGIITTLYILMDSFGTAANVMGDGALVIIVNKVLKKLRII